MSSPAVKSIASDLFEIRSVIVRVKSFAAPPERSVEPVTEARSAACVMLTS